MATPASDFVTPASLLATAYPFLLAAFADVLRAAETLVDGEFSWDDEDVSRFADTVGAITVSRVLLSAPGAIDRPLACAAGRHSAARG